MLQFVPADEVGAGHKTDDQHAHPKGTEVSGDNTGEDGQRRAALARGGHDFVYVLGMRAGENLGELRNQDRGQRAATDDRRQLPPKIGQQLRGLTGHGDRKIADEELAHEEGRGNTQDRGDPDETGQRRFEVELLQPAVFFESPG